jgi:hypothetical protein
VGYASFEEKTDTLNGKSVKRSDSVNVIDASMLGTTMSMKISSTSWYDTSNQPIRMKFLIESGGRSQLTDAVFSASSIKITSDNGGQKSTKTLASPKDAPVLADTMEAIVADNAAGTRTSFYVLDPMTLGLVKNAVVNKGKSKVDVKGTSYDAILIEIEDPRATMRMFISAKGDLIKGEGPMGMEMLPESKEEALGKTSTSYKPSTDLAFATSIKPDKAITKANTVKRLVMRVTGRDLSRLPSDEHQTVKKTGASWTVDVHPPVLRKAGAATIATAAKAQPKWTQPGTHIPSGDPKIKALSKQIVGNRKNVLDAALAIKAYVHKNMRPNAGIGVLRDATEILRTKEGVCRDYAILTAALMRASNIPTRLASGLVNWDGTFFYHAWVEVWDGKQWIGIDSTAPFEQITATHVKLSQGNVEDAYVFTFLDKVKLEVLSLQRK